MELTGACKKEFEQWLVCGDNKGSFEKYYGDKYGNDDPYLWFMEHSASMQYGVLVDYFDSVGIYITEIPHWTKGIRTYRIGIHIEYGGIIDSLFLRPKKDSPLFIEYSTRPEARTQAISKANEIKNEQLKQ